MKKILKACSTFVLLGACAMPGENMALVEGPAIVDIVTPFDGPLTCLDSKIDKRLGFAVGNIPDATGRESYNGNGTGKYVTQAAGDIVQSALFKTGVKVINRRDVGSTALEANWGLRNLQSQMPAHFVITGSVNSLDFIPGGGAYLNVGGFGGRYRQNRILVGLDIAMTNIATGQIVANIALRKQIVADEAGLFGIDFTNDKIIDGDLGGMRREALNDALRSMLQLATYELMIQLTPPKKHAECTALIDPRYGLITGAKTASERYNEYVDARAQATQSSSDTPQAPADDVQETSVDQSKSVSTLDTQRLEISNSALSTGEAADFPASEQPVVGTYENSVGEESNRPLRQRRDLGLPPDRGPNR